MRLRYHVSVGLLVFSIALFGQRRVDPRYSYHRVVGCVPLVGSGTAQDPVRPKHEPAPQPTGPPGTGIIAFTYEPSDDGKHAIVEFVAVGRQALAEILADKGPDILVFEKGRVDGTQIEAAIRQYRKDFSLHRFGVPIQ